MRDAPESLHCLFSAQNVSCLINDTSYSISHFSLVKPFSHIPFSMSIQLKED